MRREVVQLEIIIAVDEIVAPFPRSRVGVYGSIETVAEGLDIPPYRLYGDIFLIPVIAALQEFLGGQVLPGPQRIDDNDEALQLFFVYHFPLHGIPFLLGHTHTSVIWQNAFDAYNYITPHHQIVMV